MKRSMSVKRVIITEGSQKLRERLVDNGFEPLLASDIVGLRTLLEGELPTTVVVEVCSENIGRHVRWLLDIIERPEVTVYLIAEAFGPTLTGLCLPARSHYRELIPKSPHDELAVGMGLVYLVSTHRVFHCNETGLIWALEKGVENENEGPLWSHKGLVAGLCPEK
jgi:hypothetical protein